MTYTAFTQKYEEILPTLDYRASRLTCDFYTHDDLVQIMAVAIWEKSMEDEEFLTKSNSYIATYGFWIAGNAVTKEQTYRSHVQAVAEADDDNFTVWIDNIHNPEDVVVKREAIEELYRDIEEKLTEENKTIIKGVLSGMDKKTIAEKLEISQPAVSQRISTIRKAITAPRFGKRNLILLSTTHMSFGQNWQATVHTDAAIAASKAKATLYP